MVPALKSALKRTYSDLDDEAHEDSQSQRKRFKVQFNESENKTEIFWTDKSVTLVREEVRRALEQHISGASSTAYTSLTEIFTTKSTASDAPSATTIKRYLMALIAYANLLGKKCSDLVDAILDCEWLGRDEEFVNYYRRFLVNLISAHAMYTNNVLESIVGRFADIRSAMGRLPNHPFVRRSELKDRLHNALDQILRKSPTSLGTLTGILRDQFPYPTDSVKAHVDYVSNLLRIIAYASPFKHGILSLVMGKMVNIDVQIQIDVEDLEEELDESLLTSTVHMLERTTKDRNDDEDSDSEEGGESESHPDTIDPTEKRRLELKASVMKLDIILDLLFDHYHSAFTKCTIVEKEMMFNQMWSLFSRTILPTSRSRHVQFLLFHFGQSLTSLSEHFATLLVKVVCDKSQSNKDVKRSAAAYLASFIARGAHVESHIVNDIVMILGRELDRLRTVHEKNVNCGPNLQRYNTYYSIVQAMLYIFCFRWRDLLAEEEDDDSFDPDELVWEHGIKEIFTRNIYCVLNPLKVCTPGIVGQFAAVAHNLKFLYIYPKIETNKRVRLTRAMFSSDHGGLQERETALSNKTGESTFQLEAYFPFDPYSLPRSKRWMIGDYKDWQPVPGMEAEEEEVVESDTEEEDDEDEEEEYDEPTETESDAGA